MNARFEPPRLPSAPDRFESSPVAPVTVKAAVPSTLEFLLRRMRLRSDFPVMSSSVTAINQLMASEDTTAARLAAEILKDFALTNKILRLVNSAQYGQYSTTRISTISRAIVILGVDTIRSMTISLMLFDQIRDHGQATALGGEFMRASLAALLARDLNAVTLGGQAEEAYLCALFHHLGRLLAQCYFDEEAEAIRQLMRNSASDADGRLDEEAASAQVLGIGYQELGIGIARSWAFPEAMIHSMRRMAPGRVPASASAQDRLRALSAFSAELGELVESAPEAGRTAAIGQLCRRYQDSIAPSPAQAQAALVAAAASLADMARVFHIDLAATPLGRQLRSATAEYRPAASPAAAKARAAATLADINAPLAHEPLLSPAEAEVLAATPDTEAILSRGIQDLSDALLEDSKLSDLLRIVTETLYRALSAQRVILCLRDGRHNLMQARLMLGADEAGAGCGQFQFGLGPPDDLFKLILAQDIDVLIADTGEAKIRQRLPAWYVRDFHAPSFLVMPLRVKGAAVGMIYIDADAANKLVISPKAFALLRTLRNQAMLAIRQHL